MIDRLIAIFGTRHHLMISGFQQRSYCSVGCCPRWRTRWCHDWVFIIVVKILKRTIVLSRLFIIAVKIWKKKLFSHNCSTRRPVLGEGQSYQMLQLHFHWGADDSRGYHQFFVNMFLQFLKRSDHTLNFSVKMIFLAFFG